ncbi:MAG: helix-turn-helix transcriptional regulator [Bifidobacteriaceae bacterium]|nr:helix-turn-helix transcriptional regulator [Bifidobacteriaceae bacterium]
MRTSELLTEDERSVAWLSRQSGIPYPTLERVMRGEARLTMGMLASVAAALRVPVADLLEGLDQER